jgi:hypothetical protein
MSIANQAFSRIFIHVSRSFYICKRNLKQAMDKEDFGLTAIISNNHDVWIPYYQILTPI